MRYKFIQGRIPQAQMLLEVRTERDVDRLIFFIKSDPIFALRDDGYMVLYPLTSEHTELVQDINLRLMIWNGSHRDAALEADPT